MARKLLVSILTLTLLLGGGSPFVGSAEAFGDGTFLLFLPMIMAAGKNDKEAAKPPKPLTPEEKKALRESLERDKKILLWFLAALTLALASPFLWFWRENWKRRKRRQKWQLKGGRGMTFIFPSPEDIADVHDALRACSTAMAEWGC